MFSPARLDSVPHHSAGVATARGSVTTVWCKLDNFRQVNKTDLATFCSGGTEHCQPDSGR